MRYNEREEIEATSEWLLRITEAGFSEDLMYVPSELTKMGVIPSPVDVVDRLHKLRSSDPMRDMVDHGIVEVVEEAEAIVEMVEPLVFDYNSFGPWEWVDHLNSDPIESVLSLEPGLHVFNKLASLTHSMKRGRGKRARSGVKSIS